MKQNPDFVMCDVAGKHVLMPLARAAVNLDGMISLNEVGLTVWNSLAEEKSYEELLKMMVSDYSVSKEIADRDIQAFLKKLKAVGAVLD